MQFDNGRLNLDAEFSHRSRKSTKERRDLTYIDRSNKNRVSAPEGEEGDARILCAAYELGARQFVCSINAVGRPRVVINYRKVRPVKSAVLAKQSASVEEWGEDWRSEPSLARAAAK